MLLQELEAAVLLMHSDSIIVRSELDHSSVRIVLGLDEQFIQIARFCSSSCKEATVLGIDRTFDLSSMYATVTVFKQMDLFRSRTNDHPIMLGPILLSSDATDDTYRYFLTQIKWKMECVSIQGVMFNDENFILGSDQERALINAMKSVFPESTRFVCVYHICKNIQEYLRKLSVLIYKMIYIPVYINKAVAKQGRGHCPPPHDSTWPTPLTATWKIFEYFIIARLNR